MCPECHGAGQAADAAASHVWHHVHLHCLPQRRGEGKIYHSRSASPAAAAAGVRRQKKVSVKIPAGIDNGPGHFRPGPGGYGPQRRPRRGPDCGHQRAGPTASWRREGSHIYLDQAVSVLQATLGSEIEIPSLDGKIKCKVEPGTQPGTTLRLRGRGVPILNGRGRGDQYVTIRVEIPRNLNEEQKQALRKFAETMGEVPASGGQSEEKSVFHRRKKK